MKNTPKTLNVLQKLNFQIRVTQKQHIKKNLFCIIYLECDVLLIHGINLTFLFYLQKKGGTYHP